MGQKFDDYFDFQQKLGGYNIMRHTADIKALICSKTNMYFLLIFHCLLLEHNLRNLGKSMLGGQIKHEKKAQISGRAKCIYLSTK